MAVVTTLAIMVAGLAATSVATAPAAHAQGPIGQCAAVALEAKNVPPLWRYLPVHVIAATVSGGCIGYVYSKSPWWNSNFDRIMNRCWPNCSNWDFVRMVLGIPG